MKLWSLRNHKFSSFVYTLEYTKNIVSMCCLKKKIFCTNYNIFWLANPYSPIFFSNKPIFQANFPTLKCKLFFLQKLPFNMYKNSLQNLSSFLALPIPRHNIFITFFLTKVDSPYPKASYQKFTKHLFSTYNKNLL